MKRPVAMLLMLGGIEASFFDLTAGALIFVVGLLWELVAWTGE